jgi:hypothetical protein
LRAQGFENFESSGKLGTNAVNERHDDATLHRRVSKEILFRGVRGVVA